MPGTTDRFGPRRSTSAWDAASWVMAIVVLTLAIPASGKIAGNQLFFTAHGVTVVGWIVALIATLVVAWLVLVAILLAIRRWASPVVFDVAASVLLFIVGAFGLGNMLAVSVLRNAPLLGFVLGILASAAVVWLSRRAAMGRLLFAFAGLAVTLPLVAASFSTATADDPAAVTFSEGGTSTDVLWVLSDELQYPLVFDAQGQVRPEFPNMRALQQQATTYTKAYTPANYTDFAIPAQFNGVTDLGALGPAGIDRMKSSKGLIPGLAEKYSIVMDSPLFKYACESSNCAAVSPDPDAGLVDRYLLFMKDAAAIAGQTALAAPFNRAFPSLAGRWRDYWSADDSAAAAVDAAPVSRVITSLDQAQPSAPTFTFWHTLRTHAAWTMDRVGEQIYPAKLPVVEGAHLVGSDADGLFSTADLMSMQRRLYANAAVDFDRQLGVLIDHLKATGTYDSTMIVLTSDHGAAITKTGDRRRGDNEVQRWSEVAHVPLLVKYPDQQTPVVVDAPRSTGQIARTVMTVAGAEPASELPLAAGLDSDPSGRIAFADVSIDPMPVWEYSGVSEIDPWTSDDLTPPDPGNPFAIGIDLSILGQPVPEGWTQLSEPRINALAGESDQVLLVVEPDADRCESTASASLVASGDEVVGSLLWQADGERGWAIVPRSASGEYRVWCPS